MLAAIFCAVSYTELDALEELPYSEVDLLLLRERSELIEIKI